MSYRLQRQLIFLLTPIPVMWLVSVFAAFFLTSEMIVVDPSKHMLVMWILRAFIIAPMTIVALVFGKLEYTQWMKGY